MLLEKQKEKKWFGMSFGNLNIERKTQSDMKINRYLRKTKIKENNNTCENYLFVCPSIF